MASTLAPRAPFDAKKAAAAMDAKLLPFQKEGVAFGRKSVTRRPELRRADPGGGGGAAKGV